MTGDRWLDVKKILLAALEAEPAERQALLDQHCGRDAELRAEVERYLEREGEAERLLARPAVDLLATPPPEGREGTALGAFHLESEIGHGGMGVVYRAQREEPYAQTVAIKILKRGLDTEDIVRRFAQERQILSRLDHPAIARILDGGATTDGLPYLVMEHVDGTSIDHYCRDRRLSLQERLALFIEICGAVHHAHQHLIVHRDLKPANLLVDGSGRPRLLDFGIAKLLDADETTTHASVGPMTPIWASPEQRSGAPVTTASDVFALGMLLELLLTDLAPQSAGPQGPGGDRPTRDEPTTDARLPSTKLAHAARAADATDERRHLARRARRLRGDLDRIVARARHLEPQRRYASAADLAQDITRFLAGRPVTARPDSLGYRLSRLAKRHPWGTAAAVAAIAGLIAFSVALSLLLARATAARDRAEKFRAIAVDALGATDPDHPDLAIADQQTKIQALIPRVQELAPSDRAPLLNRLSQSLLRLGLEADAIDILRQAVAGHEALEVPAPRAYADTLNNLGLALIKVGQSAEGVPLLRAAIDALADQSDTYPRTLLEYKTNLAFGLERTDLDAAEALYREVLTERIERFGPDDLSVGNAANNLGFVLVLKGSATTALPLLDDAVRLRRAHLGEVHEKTGVAYSNRAAAHLELGALDEAISDAGVTVDIRRGRVRKDLRSLVVANIRHADALLSRGQPDDWETAIAQLDFARVATDEDSGLRMTIDRHTAHAWTRQGQATRAEAMARAALRRAQARDSEPWRTADLESVIGGAVLAQGRHAEARTLLEASWSALCADPQARKSALRQAGERMRLLEPDPAGSSAACPAHPPST